MHAALNNWDCKVNVRRIVKDGSFPPSLPPVSVLGSVSWLHTSKSQHQHSPRVAVGHGCFKTFKEMGREDSRLTEERKLNGSMKLNEASRGVRHFDELLTDFTVITYIFKEYSTIL